MKQSEAKSQEFIRQETQIQKQQIRDMKAQRDREKNFKIVRIADFKPDFIPSSTIIMIDAKRDSKKAAMSFVENLRTNGLKCWQTWKQKNM